MSLEARESAKLGHEVELGGEKFFFLPNRTLFWPRQAALILSDLHLGKAASFQAFGIPLPHQAHVEDLEDLKRTAIAMEAKSIWILGDFIHNRDSLVPEVRSLFKEWLCDLGLPVHLIVGNHDRKLVDDLATWGFASLASEFKIDDVFLTHEPSEVNKKTSWQGLEISGHIHPVHVLKKGGDRLRLPCFWLRDQRLTLPSFGTLTGGHEIPRSPSSRIFVCAGSSVLET